MSSSGEENDYGDLSGSGGDLGSDFGELEAEYELDKNGNPIGAEG